MIRRTVVGIQPTENVGRGVNDGGERNSEAEWSGPKSVRGSGADQLPCDAHCKELTSRFSPFGFST